MLRFHCLVTARLAWTTGLTFDTDEHSGFLHWQCGNCCHVRSDNNFTSCDAATTDRISPQNFLKPDTGCVSVSFSWPGSQAVHSVSWLCALAYRLTCTCAQRTIWEDFIWFILLVFKNILIYVATSLHPRQMRCFKFPSHTLWLKSQNSWSAAGHSQVLKVGFL